MSAPPYDFEFKRERRCLRNRLIYAALDVMSRARDWLLARVEIEFDPETTARVLRQREEARKEFEREANQ